MLQFWVPRSEAFEKAMIGTMRLPFLFEEFDTEAEKTTLRILKTIGRFEGVGDIPEDAVTSIVLNDAVRTKLEAKTDVQEDVELIRDALVEELQKKNQVQQEGLLKLHEVATETHESVEQLQQETEDKDKRIADLATKVAAKDEQIESIRTTMQDKERELSELSVRLDAREMADDQQDTIRRYVIIWIMTLVVGGIGGGVLISYFVAPLLKVTFVSMAASLCAAFGLLVLIAADLRGSRNEVVKDWPAFQQLHRFRVWLWGVIIIGLVLELAGNFVWDRITGDDSGDESSESIPIERDDDQ